MVPVLRLRSHRYLNSCGYFGGRLGCKGFDIQTNIVENYVLFKRRVARDSCTGEKSF